LVTFFLVSNAKCPVFVLETIRRGRLETVDVEAAAGGMVEGDAGVGLDFGAGGTDGAGGTGAAEMVWISVLATLLRGAWGGMNSGKSERDVSRGAGGINSGTRVTNATAPLTFHSRYEATGARRRRAHTITAIPNKPKNTE
jgi:hypothetical protein